MKRQHCLISEDVSVLQITQEIFSYIVPNVALSLHAVGAVYQVGWEKNCGCNGQKPPIFVELVAVGKAAAQDIGLSERRILTELLIAEIFKELGLNKSDDKRLRLCVLRTQYLYVYRVRTDQYVCGITILHIVCIVLCCTAIVQHCAAIAQSAVIMSNTKSYDSCAVMTLTVHVSCTYWDDRVYLYLIYDR